MKIKVLRNTIAGGKQLLAGKTADVSEQDAKTLIAMGKAAPVVSKAKKETTAKKAPENTSQQKPETKTGK
jgi:hypothetical protein